MFDFELRLRLKIKYFYFYKQVRNQIKKRTVLLATSSLAIASMGYTAVIALFALGMLAPLGIIATYAVFIIASLVVSALISALSYTLYKRYKSLFPKEELLEIIKLDNVQYFKDFVRKNEDFNFNEIKDKEGNKLLLSTIWRGSISMAREIIKLPYIDLNAKGNKNTNALIEASFLGQEEIVDLLLEKNVELNEVDGFGYTAAELALYNKNTNIFKKLIKKGVDINSKLLEKNETLLILASRLENIEAVAFLLQQQDIDINVTDIDGKSAYTYANENSYTKIADILYKAEKGEDITTYSLEENNMNIEEENIEEENKLVLKKDVSKRKELSDLIKNGFVVDIKRFIDKNKEFDFNSSDDKENNPLLEAILYGNISIARELIKHDLINLNAKNPDGYAITLSSFLGQEEIVDLLLSKGVDLNVVDNEKDSPVALAVLSENQSILSKLTGGKNIVNTEMYSHKNINKETAVMIAFNLGNMKAVDSLCRDKSENYNKAAGIALNHNMFDEFFKLKELQSSLLKSREGMGRE